MIPQFIQVKSDIFLVKPRETTSNHHDLTAAELKGGVVMPAIGHLASKMDDWCHGTLEKMDDYDSYGLMLMCFFYMVRKKWSLYG